MPLFGPTCLRCALPLPPHAHGGGPSAGCCARCVVRPLPLEQTVAAVMYETVARRFLLRAKVHGRAEILAPLGAQLAVVVTAGGLIEHVDAIVPVPSSISSRWRRGFDPAREIAREVARATGVPLVSTALRQRIFPGTAAKTLAAAARWQGAERRIVARRAVDGMRVLLVDDVLTTGSTLASCARALRLVGAIEIRGAVWARTPAPHDRFDPFHGRRL
jgi:ComF family protein